MPAAHALLGLIACVVPWDRLEPRFQLIVPLVVLVLVVFAGMTPNGPFAPFLVVLPLPFVFVGFTQRPGMAAAMAPAATLALIVAAHFHLTQMLAATVLFALPISVLTGEAIAQAQQQRARAENNVGRLLQAVRVLAHVDNQREGAQVVAALAAELLDADAVSVLLAEPPGGSRF